MKSDFWLERWTNGRIGFHQPAVNPLLQAHWADLNAAPGTKVFVPLCGKSRDMLWLRERGHEILGVEFIQIALRDFFADNGLIPHVYAQPPFERWETEGFSLWCGDFFDLTASDLRDVRGVYDRASLIALPPDMRRRYVEKMAQILPPGTETLLIAFSYPEDEMKGPPFSVTETEVRDLYGPGFEIRRLAVQDAIAANALLRDRGLSQLTEQAYRIRRRADEDDAIARNR